VQRHLKPLLVGLACSFAVFVIGFALTQFAMAYMSSEEFGQSGIRLYFAWAMLMLVVPAFAAGYVAKAWGAAYGAVLACIPIYLWSLVNTNFPTTLYLAFVGVAVVGGYLGQSLAMKRHAS
jgi:hypothetical protein